jgi:hypothetical protein
MLVEDSDDARGRAGHQFRALVLDDLSPVGHGEAVDIFEGAYDVGELLSLFFSEGAEWEFHKNPRHLWRVIELCDEVGELLKTLLFIW